MLMFALIYDQLSTHEISYEFSPSATLATMMIFPFTFTSMLPYPFYSAPEPKRLPAPSSIQSHWLRIPAENASKSSAFASPVKRRLPRPPRRVFEDDGVQPAPLQRKRGWEPAAPTAVVEPAATRRAVVGRFDTQTQYLRSQKRVHDLDGRIGRDLHQGKPPLDSIADRLPRGLRTLNTR